MRMAPPSLTCSMVSIFFLSACASPELREQRRIEHRAYLEAQCAPHAHNTHAFNGCIRAQSIAQSQPGAPAQPAYRHTTCYTLSGLTRCY